MSGCFFLKHGVQHVDKRNNIIENWCGCQLLSS